MIAARLKSSHRPRVRGRIRALPRSAAFRPLHRLYGMGEIMAFGLRTVKRRKRRAPVQHRAFTLIELILVMSLLVIMISLVAPSLAGFFRGRVLDSEARRLLSLTRAGQSRAVSAGMPMQLWFDSQKNTYGLQEESVSGKQDPKAVTLDTDASLHIVVPNGSVVPGSIHNLPAIRFL